MNNKQNKRFRMNKRFKMNKKNKKYKMSLNNKLNRLTNLLCMIFQSQKQKLRN